MARAAAHGVRGFLVAIGVWVMAALSPAYCETLLFGDAPAVSTSSAWTYFQGQGLASPTCSPPTCNIDPLVTRTAHALGDDIDRVFLFVHDQIEVTPLFGVQRGARGALIDKSGTPFDQTVLFVELARAAGYPA